MGRYAGADPAAGLHESERSLQEPRPLPIGPLLCSPAIGRQGIQGPTLDPWEEAIPSPGRCNGSTVPRREEEEQMTTSTTLSVLNTPTLTCSQDLTPIAEAFFARRSPKTREAYKRALEDFARWMMAPDGIKAILGLLAASQGGANLKVMEYMADLRKRGLSPSTLNQRLAALKSMIAASRKECRPFEGLIG